MSRYYTTAEVAERYRTAEGTVRYWRHIGYGPTGVKVGRKVLYTEEALKAFDEDLNKRAASRSKGGA